jgi:TolB-like protein/predicted negative regulator of RcsB-dependent stress response
MGFFQELKRRNVYKVAVAYAVVAWLLIQIATATFPVLEIPNWATKLVIAVVLLGFPLALIFAWAFELTPEGIKRTEDVAPDESITRKTGRKLIALVAIGATLAAGLLTWQLLRPKSAVSEPAGSDAIPHKSIAVLPFQNLSRDEENAFFAEGVQEEILTRLAKVGDLKVISRTSTQRFKSAPSDLPAIAKQLGVLHVLEGSVQKSGDAVRVNVQLINALTHANLWAETYDRKLTDIFAVESDIAKRIADTLQAKLTGLEKQAIAKRPTTNPDAHELYLKGRFFWNKRTGNDLKTAVDYFEKAIAADQRFSGAYAGLAQAYILLPVFGAGRQQDFLPLATVAARRAIELDETSAEGHVTLAMLLLFDFRCAPSEQEFRRAIELNPNYATAHHWFGNSLLVTLGRFDEAIKESERAVELDPLSLIINADLGSTLMISRRYDEAIAQLRRTLLLDGNFPYAHWNLGQALYLKGETDAAIAEYEKAAALDDDPQIKALLARAYAETGRKESALEILNKLKEAGEHQYVRNYLYAWIHVGLGEKAKAIEYLEKAIDNSESADMTWIKVDPMFDPLRNEPRFRQLVAKLFREESS